MISCAYTNPQKDKRRRFSDKQIQSIKNWYKKGWSVRRIADKFMTSPTSIRLIVNPLYKENQRKNSNIINQKKYSSDKHFKEKVKSSAKELMHSRYWTDPEYRKRHNQYGKEWREKNPNYMKEYHAKKSI